MHFHITPVKNQSSLVLPTEGRGTSQLSTRGTGRGWQILLLIHEMYNRGNASRTWLKQERVWWERGPKMKGLIVVCGFPQTLGPLVGVIRREIKVLLCSIGDSEGESNQHSDSSTPNTLLFRHKKSSRLGSIMYLYVTLLQGQLWVNVECSYSGLKFCHKI